MNPMPAIVPIAILGAGSTVVYLVARVAPRRTSLLAALTASIMAAALGALLSSGPPNRVPSIVSPGEALFLEPGGCLIASTALVLGTIVALYSARYLALDRHPDRYFPLLLLMLAGTVGATLASDLFTLYLFVVLTNGASYVLVAFRRETETAIEAGFKYAITGTMGSMFLLAGIALVFRDTGSLSLPMPAAAPGTGHQLGLGLITFGLLVKAAVFPAHTWLPDAHGRAPSSISALLSGIIVPLHIYLLVKLAMALHAPQPALGWLLTALGAGSLIAGNVLALRQSYGKRLLGYSTIAQVGYMCLAFGLGMALGQPEPIAAGFLLLVGHALLKGLAFLAKGSLHLYYGATTLNDLTDLGRRAPLVSGLLSAALLGLAGMPPLPGFAGKFALLWAIAGLDSRAAYAVAALFLLGSLVSLGYYLPLIGRLLHRAPQTAPGHRHSRWIHLPMVGLAALTLLLGVWPWPVWRMALEAARFLGGW